MKAYFDCFSGISGDMTLGALIGLGVPVGWLRQRIAQLPLDGFDIIEKSVSRSGICANLIEVMVDEGQPRRDYLEIRTLIENCPFSNRVKHVSLDILERIAVAEAQIHGSPKDRVHFHEVGGVDAIVDIVGTALCIEYLKIDQVAASNIPNGCGFTKSMHGTIPIPAPATISILKGIPTYGTGIPYELVTPTGAAIIAALARSFGPMPEMITEKIGYGSGQRILESQPNLLRVVLGKEREHLQDRHPNILEDDIVVIETNIDDMNPEWFGHVMERLQKAGALDICWLPVHMKKNRPGTMAQILCRKQQKTAVVRILLTETTSLGVRTYDAHRYMLERKAVRISTTYGEMSAKQVKDVDGILRVVPEYDECKKIADEQNVAIRDVYDTVLAKNRN
jgi:pyridinium-3,5-bisthiocarboxylic acid mononucleotide nickel chelatase